MSVGTIKRSLLKPFVSWEQANEQDVKEIMHLAHLGVGDEARLVGVDEPTINSWLSGETPIQYSAWALLANAAGFGFIWLSFKVSDETARYMAIHPYLIDLSRKVRDCKTVAQADEVIEQYQNLLGDLSDDGLLASMVEYRNSLIRVGE